MATIRPADAAANGYTRQGRLPNRPRKPQENILQYAYHSLATTPFL
jgi:hypothetical protein